MTSSVLVRERSTPPSPEGGRPDSGAWLLCGVVALSHAPLRKSTPQRRHTAEDQRPQRIRRRCVAALASQLTPEIVLEFQVSGRPAGNSASGSPFDSTCTTRQATVARIGVDRAATAVLKPDAAVVMRVLHPVLSTPPSSQSVSRIGPRYMRPFRAFRREEVCLWMRAVVFGVCSEPPVPPTVPTLRSGPWKPVMPSSESRSIHEAPWNVYHPPRAVTMFCCQTLGIREARSVTASARDTANSSIDTSTRL